MHTIDDVIRSLCVGQMAFWKARQLDPAAVAAEHDRYNASRPSIFVLKIKEGVVSIQPKRSFYSEVAQAEGSAPLIHESRIYGNFLQEVVSERSLDVSVSMALETDDRVDSSKGAPIFGMAKRIGDNAVLLPHHEFILFEFHKAENDSLAYSDKRVSAIFAGSTTGRYFDENDVRNLAFPRLRSAMFFRDSPDVDFKLTRIVQATTPEAERLLREMGFGGEVCSWEEQFKNKFIISMDGNAGSCSRVTIALKSNSALMKYDSEYVMHYFGNLTPWLHYIPISSDEQVEPILAIERRNPGFFEYIAAEGKKFFAQYLQREQLIDYTAELLRMYAGSFELSSTVRNDLRSRHLRLVAQPETSAGSSPMVSRADVIAAYQTILGREPESDEVIEAQLATAPTVADLYRNFVYSDEFREMFKTSLGFPDQPRARQPLDWPPIEVESTVADAAQLSAMFARVSATWRRLGEQDPYYSVCTDPRFRGAEISGREDAFYASGEYDMRILTSFAARSGIDLTGRNCLELGCGVGRVTRWLAPLFRRVQAVDVSQNHLAIAERELAEAAIDNVSLQQINALEDLPRIFGYDVFFSLIVLQHNPPPVIAYILVQVLNNLNPGGVAYFQVPTYALDYRFRVADYLQSPVPDVPEMEMHVLPQYHVMAIIYATGCRLLEVREDDAAGEGVVSNTFFVQKAL